MDQGGFFADFGRRLSGKAARHLHLIYFLRTLAKMSFCYLKHSVRRSVGSNRRFSSIVKAEAQGGQALSETSFIVRHGEADGVITLNVGGKEFKTLRSTIQVNPVLRDHVLKAEANKELINEAVFIDRSPENFGLILAHLRNVADSITTTSSKGKAVLNRVLLKDQLQEVNIQIPTNRAKQQDLFIEARYFQIKELEKMLCSYDLYTWITSTASGSGNPFNVANQWLQAIRRYLFATGSVGFLVGSQNESFVDQCKHTFKNVYGTISGQPQLKGGKE